MLEKENADKASFEIRLFEIPGPCKKMFLNDLKTFRENLSTRYIYFLDTKFSSAQIPVIFVDSYF